MTDQLKELRALVDYALERGITVGEANSRKREFHRKVGPETVQALLAGLDAARAEGRRSPGGGGEISMLEATLCPTCRGVGYFKDSPDRLRAAADYLVAGKMVSPPSGEVRGAIRNIIRDRVSGPQFSDVGMKIAHERDIALAADAILALIPTRDEAARPEAPEGWVLVPRDPSRKLVEDLAHEWAYDVEEACESYQGFLGVCAKHGLAGSDPGAYEAAPPPPPVAEDKVRELVRTATDVFHGIMPEGRDAETMLSALGTALEPFASPAPTDRERGR